MNDLSKAKSLLQSKPQYTCVLCRGETLYTDEKKGIAPMMSFLDQEIDLQGFSAADRIVGKAAAMLFVLAGVRALYAQVLSESGMLVLKKYGVAFEYGTLTPSIINRKGTGLCPMEEAVKGIEEPAQGREAIRTTMKRLQEQAKQESLKNNSF